MILRAVCSYRGRLSYHKLATRADICEIEAFVVVILVGRSCFSQFHLSHLTTHLLTQQPLVAYGSNLFPLTHQISPLGFSKIVAPHVPFILLSFTVRGRDLVLRKYTSTPPYSQSVVPGYGSGVRRSNAAKCGVRTHPAVASLHLSVRRHDGVAVFCDTTTMTSPFVYAGPFFLLSPISSSSVMVSFVAPLTFLFSPCEAASLVLFFVWRMKTVVVWSRNPCCRSGSCFGTPSDVIG